MNNLQKKYNKEVVGLMKNQFGYKGTMAVPKIEKISINVGLSRAAKDQNFMSEAEVDLKQIAGQAPIKTKSRQAISGFKIRKGQVVGLAVTIRGRRMWDFIEKFIGAAIPRIRDFQGIEKKSFDGQGNLSYAIKEQLVFPEISHDQVKTIFGLQVNVKTTSKTKEEGIQLLKLLGFPIKE